MFVVTENNQIYSLEHLIMTEKYSAPSEDQT